MTGPDRPDDDALRRALADVDPAAGLAPLDASQLRRLQEDAMTDTRTPTTSPTGSSAPLSRPAARARSRRPLLAAGVALAGAAAAAAVVVPLVAGDDDPAGTPEAAGTTVLEAPAVDPALGMSCVPVSADAVAGSQVAFAGELAAYDGTTAVFDVGTAFTGDPGERVEVRQPAGAETGLAELSMGELVVGEEYLVAATDGYVATCGLSGPASPELRAVYADAFRR